MKAVDTNVLARFFIDDGDDEDSRRQRPAAIAAMSERVFVSVTVLLEFELTLRGFYSLPPPDIARVLRALAGIDHVTIEDRASVLIALDAYVLGVEFPDALHVARSSRATAFVTFDSRLARRAGALEMTPAVELLS